MAGAVPSVAAAAIAVSVCRRLTMFDQQLVAPFLLVLQAVLEVNRKKSLGVSRQHHSSNTNVAAKTAAVAPA
jgi:hypothetical protein